MSCLYLKHWRYHSTQIPSRDQRSGYQWSYCFFLLWPHAKNRLISTISLMPTKTKKKRSDAITTFWRKHFTNTFWKKLWTLLLNDTFLTLLLTCPFHIDTKLVRQITLRFVQVEIQITDLTSEAPIIECIFLNCCTLLHSCNTLCNLRQPTSTTLP